MRAVHHVPTVLSGQGLPSFLWLLVLLLLCGSTLAQSPHTGAQQLHPTAAASGAVWLLAGSLMLFCAALALLSLRREKELERA